MGALFYTQPRLLVLALALLVVSGLSALHVLPRAEDPGMTSRNAIVVTPYPGASADRVEAQVSEKLEEELEEVEEIQLLESVSRAGISIVSIELADSVVDAEPIWSRVRDRVDDARLEFPAGAGEPDFEEQTITAWTLQAALVWRGEGEPTWAVLRRLALELEDALRLVPRTAETDVFGAPDEEIQVQVDPALLAARGLSVADVSAALARGDSKVPAGALDGARSELQLEVAGELDGLERVARVPVQADANGRLVRLAEVAAIERGIADPPAELALHEGAPAVLVTARMEAGNRVDRWAGDAHAALEHFQASLPASVALELVFDQSAYTSDRLAELFGNLALGALLVVFVILFTMGWRNALLVGAALPLSTLMVFTGMRALGIPMDQMSITGLIIALGLLIDNAIVMVDEVRHRLDEGRATHEAVAGAVRKMAVPLTASTATTVLAFLPLVLAVGPTGEFVAAMSVSVILAISSSLLLALTIVPALAGFAERIPSGTGWFARGFRSVRLERAWRGTLEALFARPLLAVAVATVLPVFGFWGGTGLQEQFFPPAGRDQAAIELTVSEISSMGRTREAVAAADAVLRAHPAVTGTTWVLGRSAPKFYYNQMEGVEGAPSYAGGMVRLAGEEGAREVLRELQARLDRALPASQVLVRQLEQGPPFDAPVELILSGPELDVLRERGEALRALVAAVPEVVHTRAGLEAGRPKLVFEPRDEELERAGLDRVGVAERLRASLSGDVGGSILEGVEELDVRVRVGRTDRDRVASLASLELAAPTSGPAGSEWLPLEALGSFELVPEAGRIPRRDGRRANEIHAFLGAGTLPEDALDAVRGHLADFELPEGYSLRLGGESAERDDAVGSLAATAGILVTAMIAVLVISFRSFRLAGVIGAVALLAVGLSLGSLSLFGHPFGFMAIVGTMGLIGIAINDAIVVLAGLREDPAASAGDSRAAAAVVFRATRHVLSTTLTTVAGFTPLLLQGTGLWPPLAVAIAGGVVGATLLALTFVPGAFLVLRPRPAPRPMLEPAPALA